MSILDIPFSILIEWMCFVASILFIKKPQQKFWNWFKPYLGLTVAIETYSYVVNRIMFLQIDTHWIYNIFLPIYISFHLYVFTRVIKLRFIKATCLTCLFFLIGCYILDWVDFGFYVSFSRTNTLFNGTIIMLCILYYYSLFKQEEAIDILQEASFWFVTGCLMFYATSTGVTALFAQIVHHNVNTISQTRRLIMAIINLLMYGCWIKSFICLYRTRTSLQ